MVGSPPPSAWVIMSESVGEYIRRARHADLSWPLPEMLSDEAL